MKGEERWNEIPGCNGYYDVSSLGRIRSWMSGRFGRRKVPLIKRQFIGSNGYPEVGIHVDGKKRNMLVHELVLISFIGKRPNDCVACHKNDIRTDNRISNLRWDTRSENYLDSISNTGGVLNGPRSLAKLSEEDIVKIEKLLKNGLSNRKIANLFGVSHSRISDIRNGKAYKNLFSMENAS